jgi:hypothetical protein
VIRLPKSRIYLLFFSKPFYRLWKPTDASAEQSVKDELQVNPIGGVTYVERDSFLETSTKFADIACAEEPKAEIVIKELRVGVTAANASDKIKAIRAPREDGTMTPITPPLEDQGRI